MRTEDKAGKLIAAIMTKDMETYKQLIDIVDINSVTESKKSLLQVAVAWENFMAAFDLVNRSININWQDENESTVLHFIPAHPNYKLAQLLLEKGARVDCKDKWGNNPLWNAVFHTKEDYELVKLFMRYHSDPNSKNRVGRSPVFMAEQKADLELIRILRNNLQTGNEGGTHERIS